MASTQITVNVNVKDLLSNLSLRELCMLATQKMISEGIDRHISYIHEETKDVRTPRVVIEFVDQSETITEAELDEMAKVVARVTL